MTGALLDEKISKLHGVTDLSLFRPELGMHLALSPAAIEAIVVGKEHLAGVEGQDKAGGTLRLCDFVRGQEAERNKVPEVRPKLRMFDDRFVRVERQASKPLGTNVIVAFLK